MTKTELLQILKQEIVPSLGVTEPGAVAMCCAAASQLFEHPIEKVKLIVSPNIYKNCMSVGIPGFDQKGIVAAAALGAVGGDWELGLEALKCITSEDVRFGLDLIEQNRVEVSISDNGEMLYIEAICGNSDEIGQCILQGSHTNLVFVKYNDRILLQKDLCDTNQEQDAHALMKLSLQEILRLIDQMDESDLALLEQGAEMNLYASRWGLENRPGMAAGAGLADLIQQGVIEDSFSNQLQMATAAASDVRVSGSFVSIMTCAGSGNHGITAFVPVATAAQLLHKDSLHKLKALAVSNLITVYVKNYSGKLSGMCGCGVASATGVAAGLVYLMGGTYEQICAAIKNMAGDITGMICDGAKDGCSLKLATAVASAVRSALFALNGIVIPDDNGIVAHTVEQTMQNMGQISAVGMKKTDQVILDVMQHCK